jgi:hypothetical protein
MRKLLLIGLVAAAPAFVAPGNASRSDSVPVDTAAGRMVGEPEWASAEWDGAEGVAGSPQAP